MSTAKKISGNVLGYGLTAGGTLIAIIGGVALVKMIAKEDEDTATLNASIGVFLAGTLMIYTGTQMPRIMSDEK